jgi:hypothetical protein
MTDPMTLLTINPAFSTSHLKKTFWLNIFVGSGFQILNIRRYASGLKAGSALILNQNLFFEMACTN